MFAGDLTYLKRALEIAVDRYVVGTIGRKDTGARQGLGSRNYEVTYVWAGCVCAQLGRLLQLGVGQATGVEVGVFRFVYAVGRDMSPCYSMVWLTSCGVLVCRFGFAVGRGVGRNKEVWIVCYLYVSSVLLKVTCRRRRILCVPSKGSKLHPCYVGPAIVFVRAL